MFDIMWIFYIMVLFETNGDIFNNILNLQIVINREFECKLKNISFKKSLKIPKG